MPPQDQAWAQPSRSPIDAENHETIVSPCRASLWSKLVSYEKILDCGAIDGRDEEFCKITHDLFRTERELDRAELGSKRAMRNLYVWKTSLNRGCDE